MKFAQILLLALLCSTLFPAWPGALRAQEPDRFEISDFPAYSPPYKDAAHTVMGIAQPEIRYTTGGATRRPSDSEEFLSQSYRIYRKAGYAIPPLTPRITYSQTGDRVYRAFQFDFTANSLGASTAGMLMEEYDCGTAPDGVNPADFRNWIALDNSIDGMQTYVRMHVLSHEMLHAFQFAHPLFYRDCPPGWIQEGLADAAANFITEQRFPGAWKRQKRADLSSWRSYRVAFQDDQDWLDDPHYREVVVPLLARFSGGNSSANLDAAEAMGYHTSGFWQFLARRSTGKKPGGAGVDDVSSLLATWYPMLQTTTNGRVGRSTGWLNLVNDFVAAHVNLEEKQADNALYAWLPEFFTEYATWWEVRNPALKGMREEWLKLAFGGCEQVELKAGKPSSLSSQKITLTNMRKNSARCIDVKLSGFTNPVSIQVMAEFPSGDPDQFHLGLARVEAPSGSGTTVESCWDHWNSKRLMCRRLGKAGEHAKTWKAEQVTKQGLKLGGKTIDATFTYVFSNVGLHLDTTRTIETLDLTFSATYTDGGDKDFAPPKSIHPLSATELSQVMTRKKETFYRLYTFAAQSPTNLFDIELNQLDSGEQPRCGGDGSQGYCAYDTGGDFLVKPMQEVAFGQTGPIAAAVYKTGDSGTSLATTFCAQDADLHAVEILESGVDGLVVRINADLCDLPMQENRFCRPTGFCPKRDHLSVTFTLGLGREHFAQTTPVHLLTPGTRFDIDLYFRDGIPTGGPGDANSSPPGGSSTSGPPGGDGGSANPGAGSSNAGSSGVSNELQDCSCTCAEREETNRRSEELKARSEAGEDVSINSIMALTRCTASCQREYMICEMKKADREKEEKVANRRAAEAARAAACDCSCAGLRRVEQLTSEMQQQMQSGQSPSLETLQQVSQCAATCQAEYLQCRLAK